MANPKSSKFSGIFDSAPAPEAPGRIEAPATESAIPLPRLGRPPSGKRSDPAWKQFSVFLRRDTQREATNILRNSADGSDFSSLVQRLVEDWIVKNRL